MNIQELHKKFTEVCKQQVCTDTRKPIPGAMFFALKGEHFDGNEYAQTALELGCNFAVVSDQSFQGKDGYIVVPDVLETLQNLAHHHRSNFNIPVVAVAGSNGKTTTKELIYAASKEQKNVIATEGNLNNHIGVPLTLLRIEPDTDLAVIEMGANAIGEIAKLCELALPNYGVITNFGRDHLGIFGGVSGVIEANLELFNYLKENNGYVFANASDDMMVRYSSAIEHTLYGPDTEGMFNVEVVESVPVLTVLWKKAHKIETQLVGLYNLPNIAAAIAVASHLGVTDENIIQGIESYLPKNNRSEIYTSSKANIVIKDFYNANASSMEAAIEGAQNIKEDRELVLILGDMFELGEYASQEHQYVANCAMEVFPDTLILVGKDFSQCNAPEAKKFQSTDELVEYLQDQDISNSVVLIKGSNGMNFQKVFDSKVW